MHCRNCQHDLDDEFRYCPHCGSPSSFGWPSAGGPWLRRPAVIAGFALLLIAWLAALQTQLGMTPRAPAGSAPPGYSQVAARPPAVGRTAGPTAAPLPAGAQGGSPSRQGRSASGSWPAHRHARPSQGPGRTIASVPAAAPQPARPGRGRAGSRRAAGSMTEPPFTRGRALLAAYRTPLRRPSIGGSVKRIRERPRPVVHRPAARPWTQRPVYVQAHGPRMVEPVVPAANLVVNISARPYGVKTYVYMDGGRELGIAPLRVQFDRPGRHRLLFFAPALGPSGRAYRTLSVTGQRRLWVDARLAPSGEIARF